MIHEKWQRIWCSQGYCAQVHILNLDRPFPDPRVPVTFHFLPPTSPFLFFVFPLHAAVALEPLDLEMDGPDLICALEHNTPVSTRYVAMKK
jgi:hypothetical protein